MSEPNKSDWRRGFQRVLAKLLVIFPQGDKSELGTELRLEAYYEALTDCSLEEVEHAADRAIKQRGRVYMPTPGELLEFVDGIRADRRLDAERTAERQRMLKAGPPTPEEESEVRKMLDGLNDKMRWRE